MTTPESGLPAGGSGPGVSADEPDRGVRAWQGWWVDAAAVASFVALGFWVTARLWLRPSHGIRDNRTDQSQFEWMMAHGARVLTDFVDPFTSDRMNVPESVNLMANTSVLSVSLPMTPVTLLLGVLCLVAIVCLGPLGLFAWIFDRQMDTFEEQSPQFHLISWIAARIFCEAALPFARSSRCARCRTGSSRSSG